MDSYIKRVLKKNGNYEYFKINNNNTNNQIKITDKNTLEKINKIYIAPAYKDVKIYLDQKVLATGIDSAGRKQYIYSEGSKKEREIKKHKRLTKLSSNILSLKRKINNDLKVYGFTKNKLIALVLKIMDLCNFRGGNKIYEKKYGSYGLTTLHKKHISIKNKYIEIDFVGKKGVNNNCIIQNKNIQDIVKKVYKLSNKDDPYIFSITYNNEDIKISMTDLNDYLKQYNITCKDLRTWNANILFLKNLKSIINNINDSYYQLSDDKKLKLRKKICREAIKETALSLHHTPAICKSSYIFKHILEKIENDDNIIRRMNNNIIFENLLKDFL
jgi:DNA topoisomerase-1